MPRSVPPTPNWVDEVFGPVTGPILVLVPGTAFCSEGDGIGSAIAPGDSVTAGKLPDEGCTEVASRMVGASIR